MNRCVLTVDSNGPFYRCTDTDHGPSDCTFKHSGTPTGCRCSCMRITNKPTVLFECQCQAARDDVLNRLYLTIPDGPR